MTEATTAAGRTRRARRDGDRWRRPAMGDPGPGPVRAVRRPVRARGPGPGVRGAGGGVPVRLGRPGFPGRAGGPAARLRRPPDPGHRGGPAVRGARGAGAAQARGPRPHRQPQDQQRRWARPCWPGGWARPRWSPRPAPGQHGVATATVAAHLGLGCTVYMGERDIARQELNVFRMELLGATVVPVTSGARTLKDATNEALRHWVTTVDTTHYCIGSVMGPHPYPWMVREFQRVIGDEARGQCARPGWPAPSPDVVVACVGGGSNAAGTFAGFADTPGPADRRRGRGRRRRDARAAGRAARLPLQVPAGRGRPDHRGALDLGGPGLPGRRPRARLSRARPAGPSTSP